jgi:hypothetical protein
MKKQGRNVTASSTFDNISGLLKEAMFSGNALLPGWTALVVSWKSL